MSALGGRIGRRSKVGHAGHSPGPFGRFLTVLGGVFALLLALGLAWIAPGQRAGAAAGTSLVGTFRVAPGRCSPSGQSPSGSYFRLIFPGGSVSAGKFFVNASSLCADKSYTLLRPGSQLGLITGAYQPGPLHPFGVTGSSRANSIVRPVSFTGVNLSLSTSAIDPQTKRRVPVPEILNEGGKLGGQVEALSAQWDRQYINQGSPKPGGSRPGATVPVAGTYNAGTNAYELTWSSQIVGGRFNGFTGYWHLEGKFTGTVVGSASPSHAAPPRGSSKKTTTTTTRSRVIVTPAIKLVNCGPIPGGWSSGGLAVNHSTMVLSYRVHVVFTTSAGRPLASASAVGSLAAGKFGFWSVSASFKAPNNVRCRLAP
jgi:hypothetical protein